MAKPKARCKLVSYGIYDGWDRGSKSLPQITDFRREVPARIGIEFARAGLSGAPGAPAPGAPFSVGFIPGAYHLALFAASAEA